MLWDLAAGCGDCRQAGSGTTGVVVVFNWCGLSVTLKKKKKKKKKSTIRKYLKGFKKNIYIYFFTGRCRLPNFRHSGDVVLNLSLDP